MKTFGLATILGLSACCFLSSLNPVKAYADTANLKFVNVGPGNSADGYYTYPYNFSVNGSKPDISLMCVSFNEEIYFGESWKADVYSITAADVLAGNNDYEEAAWLYNDANVNPSNSNADQVAAWNLFDPAAPLISGAQTQLNAAAAAIGGEPSSFYDQFEVYIPIPGSESTGGLPQTFIGDTPEPSSLILLGTGLLSSAGMLYRRRRRV